MSAYDERPWLARYTSGVAPELAPEHIDTLAMFHAAARRSLDAIAVRYFDGALSLREVDEATDALRVRWWHRASFAATGSRSTSRTSRSSCCRWSPRGRPVA